MDAPEWEPPEEFGKCRHSVLVDIELWSLDNSPRHYSCALLSSVWQHPVSGRAWRPSGPFHVIRLSGAPEDLPMLIRVCEEFALHEWLPTTAQDVIMPRPRRTSTGTGDPLLFALNEPVPPGIPTCIRALGCAGKLLLKVVGTPVRSL